MTTLEERERMDFDVTERATLAGLADALVPAAEGMPAASAVGVHEKWLDRVTAARPDLILELKRVLAASAGTPADTQIERLRATDEAGFTVVHLAVVSAYYMSPRVRRLLGYEGQKNHPAYLDEADYYLEGGLLDPVVERGAVYRPTP